MKDLIAAPTAADAQLHFGVAEVRVTASKVPEARIVFNRDGEPCEIACDALFSMRSPTVTRLYLQCAADQQIDDWPDDGFGDPARGSLESA